MICYRKHVVRTNNNYEVSAWKFYAIKNEEIEKIWVYVSYMVCYSKCMFQKTDEQ